MKTILIQLDTDAHASTFDRVVAVDAGIDEVFSYAAVTPDNVEPLVHGAMFTRGPQDLAHTAIFVGGSDVAAGEALLKKVSATFFGPVRVSVMMDSSGSNTTAAAAVLAAKRHVDPAGRLALVLGSTGPVGYRVTQLLASLGSQVRVGSRSLERADRVCEEISSVVSDAHLKPVATGTASDLTVAGQDVEIIVAAGAAGVELLSIELRKSIKSLRVAIDLNAVPPLGLAGVNATDRAAEREGAICYGAIGVGGMKMRIHKAAVRRLFETNDQVLDTSAIYRIGESLE